jgi:glyoxylase-like metal-dependent hydrolase (beta-lactamase superfamily II)
MNLTKEVIGLLGVNCYFLTTDNAAVIIDPAKFTDNINDFCKENSNKKIAVLLTHCHCDHILGAEEIRTKYGAEIMIGKDDAIGLSDTRISLAEKLRFKQNPFFADVLLNDGDIIKVEDIELEVIATPGHTIGGVCYFTNGMLFSGDTLFLESFGRTDFYGGDAATLKASIDKLLCLPDEVKVYPGHGDSTTVSHEKKYNVYKGYL